MTKRSRKKKAATREVSAIVRGPSAITRGLRFQFSRDWLGGLILLLAVFLIYQPVWYAGFIWDDDAHVTANPCIVGPLGFKEIWTTSAADICPLTRSTFWVEHALWGLTPLPYHLVNVLLHGACAVLLWRVLRSLQAPGAWLGAALWAVHPVEVESVAWITEMKNTESGLFFLLSILFFVRWLKARDLDNRTSAGWNYGLTLLFAALAMASKSSTVILPMVLCLCAWWVEGRWQWRNLARVGPIFLMSIAASAVSIWTQKLNGAYDPQTARSWPERLAAAGDAVWFYLDKLLWPHPLITIYPGWQINDINTGQWLSYLPLLAVIIVLFILWHRRRSWSRSWFFVFAYFLAALLPVLGLVNNTIFRYSPVFDHFQYLASMGPLALAGAGIARFSDFVMPKRPWQRFIFSAGPILVLGIVSWQRAWVYENEETLWTDTLAKNPGNSVGYYNLGVALFQKGQVNEAIDQYEKALKIDPNDSDVHYNLGNAFSQKGQMDEAMAQYQKALEIYPDFAKAHYNLGKTLAQRGRVDEAIDQYQKTLKSDPTYVEAYNNLGELLSQKGQVDEAAAQYQQALQINPNYIEAHNNLGELLSKQGQMDEAISQYQQALQINPNLAEAHNNLGLALARNGQIDEAIAQYQQALQINPNLSVACYNLGNALFQNGRMDEAMAQYQQALKINPDIAEAHNNLGIALARKGRLGEATAQFQDAVRLKPDFISAQNNLAKALAITRQKMGQK